MEPYSLVRETGEGSWLDADLACGLQNQRLMARPPARAGGRSGLLTGGESGKPKRLLSAFSQRVSIHVPSPPSRWAGRYGPFNVRAAGQVTSEKYNFPPHNPTREGSPEGRTSSPRDPLLWWGCGGGGCTSHLLPGLRPSHWNAGNGPSTGWAGWGRGQVPFGRRERKPFRFPTFSSRQQTTSPARPSRWAGHEALVFEAAGQAPT